MLTITPKRLWHALVVRCSPLSASPPDRALGTMYAVIIAGGAPLFAAFTASDVIRGFHDTSYLREIPVNSVAFLSLIGLALARGLPRTVRGVGLALPLIAVALSDQIHAGQGGLGPLVLVLNTATLAMWHRQGTTIGSITAALVILGPAIMTAPSVSRSGGPESLTGLALRLGATLMIGVLIGQGIRALNHVV